jgi:hypothetical protein
VARYFFHLCDACDALRDPDGRQISRPADIAAIALKEARWCISQDVLEGRIDLGQWIEVHDAAGKIVHRLAFGDAVSGGTD